MFLSICWCAARCYGAVYLSGRQPISACRCRWRVVDDPFLGDLVVMSRDVFESVEGCAGNRRVVSVVVVEVEPAGQCQASFGF